MRFWVSDKKLRHQGYWFIPVEGAIGNAETVVCSAMGDTEDSARKAADHLVRCFSLLEELNPGYIEGVWKFPVQ